ncbi:MAG: tetratricopeptide repeat protein [Bacteroidales bacterium]
MKKLNFLTSFFIAALILSSCGGLDKMAEEYGSLEFSSTPEVLEMHGGKVEYQIDGTIPPDWFHKKATVEFTPVLKYDGGEETLESKTYQGEDVEGNNKVITNEDGDEIDFSGKFDYNEDMRVSDLVIKGVATIDDESVEIPEIKFGKGVKATPELVQKDPKPLMMADKFERVKEKKEKADIHYLIERSNVRDSELSKDDIKQLEKFVQNVEDAENKKYKELKISAYASPDGPTDLNERLSEGREESANKYFDDVVSKKKLSKEDAKKLYEAKRTTEDWEGFKKLVEESDIEDKDLILRVLSMHSDPEVREKELKNMAETWEELADDILPELRRSELYVKVEEIGFSDDEIKDFVDSDPDTLNLEEALYAGYKLFKGDLDKQLQAFELAVEKEENCLRAHNNIGYIKIKQGKIGEATEAIEKANSIKEGAPQVLNNLGVIALHNGNIEEAKEYFLDATDAGDKVKYNLGIINIIEGEYESAVNYMQSFESFNTALAMLLSGESSKANNMLATLDETDAMVNYLEAVIAARDGDDNEVYENLRTAVEEDEELKETAKTDMEFVEYFENETFQSIVE